MDFIRRAAELLDQGEAFCLATVLTARDPDLAGRKILVRADGSAEGSTGSPDLDREILARSRQALDTGENGVAVHGDAQVFYDVLVGEARLLVCGAGHIAVPLSRYARDAGFAVTVLDDRPEFANEARFPGCRVVAEEFVPALRELPLGRTTYVVIITRGHEHDAECLSEVLPRETAYVGLIGSRRRVAFVLQMLAEQGLPRDRLEDVFTPIGLPIGAESPVEIALSILAELVCVRRKGRAQALALRAAVGGGQ